MQPNNSLYKVLFYSILLLLFGELTKYGGGFIAISFLFCFVFIFFVKKINLIEVFSILIILSSYGQILRGANGFVTYISLIFAITLMYKLKFFKFRLPLVFIFIIISQLFALLNFQNNIFSSLGGFISLLGVFTSVLFIKNINWNKNNLVFFLKILCIIPYLNIVMFITEFLGVNISLFLFSDNVNQESDFLNLNKYGSFGSSELMGEAMMICSIISLSFLNHVKRRKEFLFFLISFMLSLILIMLAFSRSIIVLTLLFVLLSILYNRGAIFKKRTLAFFIAFIFLSNVNLNQDKLIAKFSENTNFIQNFLDNPFLAENTSREYLFKLAIDKINSKPYILGDGYRLPEENKKTWLGDESENWADYHNLYYSIIPIFGWVVLVLFVLLLLSTLKKLLMLLFVYRKKDRISMSVCFIFMLITIAFTVGQFKINALRTGSYFYFLFSLIYLMYHYSSYQVKKSKN